MEFDHTNKSYYTNPVMSSTDGKLSSGSPAINKGHNTPVLGTNTAYGCFDAMPCTLNSNPLMGLDDLDGGDPRVVAGTVDIGADEY